MNKVKYISLYIKCDDSGYPYRVSYQYDDKNILYRDKFQDMKSANNFLKELYAKVEPGFLHYNYTMPKYNAESKDAYFFVLHNDQIKQAYEHDFLARPVNNMHTLKRSYKELYGKRLKLNGNKQPGKYALPISVIIVCSAFLGLLSYGSIKLEKIQKETDIKAKKIEEREKYLENKIQELKETKTINMMDTIKQNSR